jgi:hypothetical protein
VNFTKDARVISRKAFGVRSPPRVAFAKSHPI